MDKQDVMDIAEGLRLIEEGVEIGAFRSDIDPSLAAKSVWASMHGLTMMIVHIPTFPA